MTDVDGRPSVSAPPPRRVPRRKRVVDDWRNDPWDDTADLSAVQLDRSRRGSVIGRVVGFSFLVVLAVMILVAGAVGYWVLRQVNPPGDAGAKVNFTINQGDTIETLAIRLEQQGIITNAKVFKQYVKRKGGYVPLVGYYTVRPKDTMGNILAVLKTPPALTFETVTFPEGFTFQDMGKRLGTKVPRLNVVNFATASTDGQVRSKFEPEGVVSLEGLLFPDTYQVAGNEDETSVVKRMVNRMERVAVKQGIEKVPYPGSETCPISTSYQVLTIASISGVCLTARAQVRSRQRADEFQRSIQLEALAIGFGAFFILSMTGGMLHGAAIGDPAQALQITFIGGTLTWIGALGILTFRNRRAS